MPLQIRRGTQADLNAITPAEGELVYVIPASLTDTQKLYIGDGVTPGNALAPVTGYSDSDAKEAAAESLLEGTHKNISFSFDSVSKTLSATVDILTHETIEADAIDVAAVKDGSTIILDVANAQLFGNVMGDLKGSVFADDSTLLVDAVAGNIPGSAISGTVTADFVGTFNGPVVTNLISSSDSSTIDVDTPVRFQTDIQVDGISRFQDELVINTETTNQRFLSITQVHDSASSGSAINLRRSRGNLSSLSTVADGDNIGNLSFTAYEGTIYTQSALIRATANGTVSTGRIPSRIEFLTVSDFTGELTEKMYIGSRNEVRLNSELHVYSSIYDPSPMTWFQQSHSTPDARNFSWIRTRGTIDAPLAVQNGDDIVDLVFQGHDGVNPLSQVAAAITVKVDSAVSAGNVRGAFEFATYNGTALANRVTISSAGLLSALNNLSTPNISPVSTNGDLELDPAAKGTGTVNFKAPTINTVGTSGAASAPPAQPATYLKVKVNGTEYLIPAYNPV